MTTKILLKSVGWAWKQKENDKREEQKISSQKDKEKDWGKAQHSEGDTCGDILYQRKASETMLSNWQFYLKGLNCTHFIKTVGIHGSSFDYEETVMIYRSSGKDSGIICYNTMDSSSLQTLSGLRII